MKMRWNIIGSSLVVLSLVTALTVYAGSGFGGRHHHGHHGGGGFPFRILKQLDLTEQQKTQIQSIMQAHREAVQPLKKEMHDVHASIMKKLLAPGTVTANDLATESERAADLHKQLLPSRLALGIEIRNVLTDSQRARAAELIAQWQARKAERGHSSADK